MSVLRSATLCKIIKIKRTFKSLCTIKDGAIEFAVNRKVLLEPTLDSIGVGSVFRRNESGVVQEPRLLFP